MRWQNLDAGGGAETSNQQTVALLFNRKCYKNKLLFYSTKDLVLKWINLVHCV